MAKQDSLDAQTRDLVRFAAAIAQGYEPELRERVGPLRASQVSTTWVEELILQSVLMVAEVEGQRFCLLVDELIGKQEVVIKSLGEMFQNLPGIAGGAILGDGRVGLILDLDRLFKEEIGDAAR